MLKEKVQAFIAEKDLDALKDLLNTTETVELLHTFYDLSLDEQVIVFRFLNKDEALALFEQLDTEEQENLIRSFTDDKTIEFVNELAPDDRVKLLDELPATVAKKLLNALTPDEWAATNLLLGYKAQTAGRIMTTEYLTLKSDMTVVDVLARVREQAKEKETIYNLYVTSTAKQLEGVLSLKELLMAELNDKVADIMNKKPISVTTDTDQEETAKLLQELDLLAVPVVDKENRLVGIVTIDDAIDILEEEATEDIMDAAGLAEVRGSEKSRSEVLLKGSTWQIWRVRLPFLLITLVAGIAAGLILEGFEDILESIVIIAFFIPLIMDMGGNVGSQSTTVFARGVALGHVNMKKFFKLFVKEAWIGFSMGVLLSAVTFGVIYFWLGNVRLGIAVAGALTLTMTIASSLGFLVPYVLIKLNVDQAAGSAPIITSVKDITGILIYFGFIALLLGSYLEPNYEVTEMHVTMDGIHFVLDPEEETAVVVGWEDNIVYLNIPEEITVGGEEFEVLGIAGTIDSDEEYEAYENDDEYYQLTQENASSS